MADFSADPLDSLTLPDFARLLLGVDHTKIHSDLARLGYITSGKCKSITAAGQGLFRYQEYEEGWNATIRPTEAGRERIVEHYLDDELTMRRPYYKSVWNGVATYWFDEHRVAAYADRIRDELTPEQQKTVDDVAALKGRPLNEPSWHPLAKRVHALGMVLITAGVIPA